MSIFLLLTIAVFSLIWAVGRLFGKFGKGQ
jgi:hypothetical protein